VKLCRTAAQNASSSALAAGETGPSRARDAAR
jgi:hypothetical protein